MAKKLNPFQRRIRELSKRTRPPIPDSISELIYAAEHAQPLTPSEHRTRLLSDLMTYTGPLTLPFTQHLCDYVFHDLSIPAWCNQNHITYSISPNPRYNTSTLITFEYHEPKPDFFDSEL